MKNFKLKIKNYKAGMTYVELIVVLGIFAVMSGVVLFNYKGFQAKIDIKNLASDIALKIVEAQKSAINGKLYAGASASWKPAYGVYFDLTADTKSFIYFADFSTMNNNLFEGSNCTGECLSNISITKGNFISSITAAGCSGTTSLSIVFTRPDSSANMKTNTLCTPTSADIIITSPTASTNATIKLYPSGRIQVN